MTEQEAYVRAVRHLYLQLPNTSGRFSRSDRQLAQNLYHRGIPIDILRSALLLATARRVCRDPAIAPLSPVRSLHYFLPVLDEILLHSLPHGYLQYIEYKIAQRG
jgi:hypothetical protein